MEDGLFSYKLDDTRGYILCYNRCGNNRSIYRLTLIYRIF